MTNTSGWVLKSDAIAAADKEDISESTLQRAADSMKLKKKVINPGRAGSYAVWIRPGVDVSHVVKQLTMEEVVRVDTT